MKTQNGITMYTSAELSNEVYHSDEFKQFMSGSDLAVVTERTPATLEYGENKESPALKYGIAAHTMLLENEKFNDEIAIDLDIEDFPTALKGTAKQKAYLKEIGFVGYTKLKTQQEVVEAIKSTGADVIIWEELYQKFLDDNEHKTIIKKEHEQEMLSMRHQIMTNADFAEIISSGIVESSFIGELNVDGETFKVKVRPDLLSADMLKQWDYKTTICASPEDFGKQAYNRLYWMKEALKHDVLAQFLGQSPQEVALLAQEKTMPFLCKAYKLTKEQIEYGRAQYIAAARQLKHCRDRGSYYGYGKEIEELFTPTWAGI